MIVKRINLCALDTGSLTLGYVGENDHTQIRINCASVFADYPSAVVSMTVKAPSGVVYPREVETDGQVVIWTITDSDTASAGNGQIQLTFTEDGTIVKTVIAVTTVRASLVGDNPPPDPITDWIDEAGEALAKLEGITASATPLPAGEDPTAEVEIVDGHYNIALGLPGADAESIIDDTAGVGDTTKVWSANKSATDLSELKSAIDRKAPVINQTASGNIVSFTDGADNMPLSSCVVSIDPVQSGSGDPSPTNVRPISGHTETTVTRTGRNLFDESLLKDQAGWNYIDVTVKPNMTYVVSANLPNDGVLILYAYNTAGWVSTSQVYDGKSVAVTTNEDGVIRLQQRRTADTKSFADYQIQLELGSTATAYEPYQGQTYPITFPSAAGTVYGGTVDLEAQTLTVDRAKQIFTGAESSWGEYPSYNGYYITGVNGMKSGTRQDGLSNMLRCSKTSESGQTNAMWLGVNSSYLFVLGVYETMGSTLEAFKSYLSTHNLEVEYPLANPVTYSLSDLPTITTLRESNIWADTGAISMTYPADTRTYVDDHTPVQDVQINGTSILSDGVANVPVATDSVYGVAKVSSTRGIDNSSGFLTITPATPAVIKAGTDWYKPLGVRDINVSTFYGLARAAGADMASSSNPVGTYTDSAKTAIQKMLGVYQAPWELIREDTITNATQGDLEITVDGNGQAYELTDIFVWFFFPKQDTDAAFGDYGRIRIYYNSSSYVDVLNGAITMAAQASARGSYTIVRQEKGAVFACATSQATTSDISRLGMYITTNTSSAMLPVRMTDGIVSFTKIIFKSILGTMNYKIYGKRKWT